MSARGAVTLFALSLGIAWSAPALAASGKKDAWLAEKAQRAQARHRRAPPRRLVRRPPERLITLRNLWTNETLPVSPRRPPRAAVINEFLRCHHNHAHRAMDRRLVRLLIGAARRFRADSVEIVSGFRSPEYNAVLRGQGRQVARESQHLEGRAVDFRIPAVPTARLVAYVKAQNLGGVGYYPQSRFVHADTGPVRFWRGR